MTTDKVFDMVKKIRKTTQIPMVFLTYINLFFPTEQNVLRKSAKVGMDGLIVPDLPYEEKEELLTSGAESTVLI